MPLNISRLGRCGKQARFPRRVAAERQWHAEAAVSSNSPTCCASSRTAGITNTVWLTADVHCTAAHYYNPDKAQFGISTRSGSSSPGRSMLARSVQRPRQ
ncbi:hypothetical protein ACVOMV_04900 [Mesorhizobium atlanticum]